MPSWTKADASVMRADVPDCAQAYTSAHYQALEQKQIFVLGNQRCTGRYTVYATLSADAQQVPAERSYANVSIHAIHQRQGDDILQIGSNICDGRPEASRDHFDHTSVSCSVTRSLSAGQTSELSVNYSTDATKNAHMETWWTYEPGL